MKARVQDRFLLAVRLTDVLPMQFHTNTVAGTEAHCHRLVEADVPG